MAAKILIKAIEGNDEEKDLYEFSSNAQTISESKSDREINILLIGESGCGKSTFINAFVNYLTNDTLAKAVLDDLVCLIPSKYTITDMDFNEVELTVGDNNVDCNEVLKAGESATQDPKAHVLKIENKGLKLRIIDTPGLGDTSGIFKDKKHCDNIINYLSHYEYLDAICILLKPNNSRLGITFTYIIKELLTCFHKNAAKNIIFCFTNCRSTFYRPGDTLPLLRNIFDDVYAKTGEKVPLNASNIFCFDNEAFRFLIALKHDIDFNDTQRDDFTNSWEKSVSTAKKMMKHLMNLPPHLIKESIELQEARNTLYEMSRPISQISQSIQSSARAVFEIKKEFETNELLSKIKNLNITQLDVKKDSLNYLRTVCTKCAEAIFVNDVPKIHYKLDCHEKCKCLSTNCDVVNNTDLQKCTVFVNGFCKVCQCSWNVHMHIGYETKIVNTLFIDSNIQEFLNEQITYDEKKKKIIDKLDSDIHNLQFQRNKLIEISAKIALCIKKNSIIEFNDEILEYINLCIKEEESSLNINNTKLANQLEELFKISLIYTEQKNIFEKANEYVNENDASSNEFSRIKNEIMNENNPQLKPIIIKLQEHQINKNSLLQDFKENVCEVKPNMQKLHTSILLHKYKK